MWEVLVIGCNGITKKWLDALKGREDVVLVAFADPAVERAEALRAAYAPGAKVYDGADAALEDCKANLVLDATPPFVHHAVVTRALREGRCVLGEKPMADDLDRAREMVACAQESGRPYFVMQNRRYLRGIQTLRAELAKTYLGKPYLVTCDMFLGAHFMGPGDGRPDFRNRMEHPVLVDMLIHTFDQARFLLGEKRRSAPIARSSIRPTAGTTIPPLRCAPSRSRTAPSSPSAAPGRPSAKTPRPTDSGASTARMERPAGTARSGCGSRGAARSQCRLF